MRRGDRDPSYLNEPREDGSVTLLGADYVSFTPQRNEAGEGEMRGQARLKRRRFKKRVLEELPLGETGEPTLAGQVRVSGGLPTKRAPR